MSRYRAIAVGLSLLMLPSAIKAQTPATPKVYSGNFGAGLSLTGGNTDTLNFNISGELTRDPKKRNVIKINGLYFRADTDDVKTADRLTLAFRDEYALSQKAFVYGAFGYLRDPFKAISYVLNPQGGLGYKPLTGDRVELTLSGGAGAVWEKNPGIDVQTSGTLNAGQSFVLKLSETAKFTEGVSAFWKTSDFNDYLVHFNVAIVTTIIKAAEMKVQFIDDFKNVTPSPAIKKNDTAFLIAFLYKF